MAWSDWVNVYEATPTDATYANEIDDFMQALAEGVGDRLAGFLYGFATGETSEAPGLIEAIFKQQASAPAVVNADEIRLYALDDGANCGLSAKNEDGYTCQILKKIGTTLSINGAKIGAATIPAGAYVADSIDEDDIQVANNQFLKAKNAAGNGEVNLIKANASDVPEILVGAVLSAETAPGSNAAIANKKYVDDKVAAEAFSPDPMTGNSDSSGSITFPNGFIIKWGITGAISAGGTATVTHGMTKCFQAFITESGVGDGAVRYTPYVTSIGDTTFAIVNSDAGKALSPVRWLAIGR